MLPANEERNYQRFNPDASKKYQGGGDVDGLLDKFTNAAYKETEGERKAKVAKIEAQLDAETDSEKREILETQLAELQHPVDKYLDKCKEKRNGLNGMKNGDGEQKAA